LCGHGQLALSERGPKAWPQVTSGVTATLRPHGWVRGAIEQVLPTGHPSEVMCVFSSWTALRPRPSPGPRHAPASGSDKTIHCRRA